MKNPMLAVDAVLFSIIENKLSILLVQISSGLYKNKWALPGGLVDYKESLDDAVKKHLIVKTNIKDLYLEQVYTFGNPDRDKRDRSVSVAYMGLINDSKKLDIKTKEYYKDAQWYDVPDLPDLAFDHKEIINTAYERLKSKLSYSNIASTLLPKEFTLTQLQNVYEIIYNKNIDKRNFRKSSISKGMLDETNNVQESVSHRPAKLYKFAEKPVSYL